MNFRIPFLLILLFTVIRLPSIAQVSVLPTNFDFGNIEIASSLHASYALINNDVKNVYLLKVEVPDGIKYTKPTKALTPGATDTLRITYTPNKAGPFIETIKLYFSNDPKPKLLRIKGNLKTLDHVADLDCPTFNENSMNVNVAMCDVNYTVIDTKTKQPIANAAIANMYNGQQRFVLHTRNDGTMSISVKPDLYQYQVSADGYKTLQSQYAITRNTRQVTFELTPLVEEVPVDTVEEVIALIPDTINKRDTTIELSVKEYAYNNIVFLIDVSSSMSTSDRMPLLKKSMTELVKRLRNGDRVAIVTYSDKAKIIRASAPVTNKDELQNIIAELTAGGGTSADKGLAVAQQVLLDNYLQQGNNQLVLATDGSFTLKEKDLRLFSDGAANGNMVNICVVGFGKNKDAIKSLKKTSKRFNGKFIHIDKSEQATNALLDEVKNNSKRQ